MGTDPWCAVVWLVFFSVFTLNLMSVRERFFSQKNNGGVFMKKIFIVALMLLTSLSIAACARRADQVTVTLTSELEEATLTVSPSATVDVDTQVTVEASEVAGYTFAHWKNVETGIEVSTNRVYTFPAVASLTLEAVYTEDVAIADVDTTLTSALASAVLTKTPTGPVAPGTEVTIEASSVSGYEFVHWWDEDANAVFAETAVYTFVLSEDKNLVAVYVEEGVEVVDITFESDTTEAVMTMTPIGPVAKGTEVTIEASSVTGYLFLHWLDVGADAVLAETKSHTFTLNTNMTLKAVYEEEPTDPDTVNATLTSNIVDSVMTMTPTGPVAPGTEVTIETSEMEGHVFLHWWDVYADALFAETLTHTFTLNEDMNLKAVYITEAAHQAALVLADFDGGLGHLETLMANFMTTDAFALEFVMVMEVDDSGMILSNGGEDHEMRLTYRNVKDGDVTMHELKVYAKLPDFDGPGDALDLHFIVIEHPGHVEMYVDVGILLDQLTMETGLNLRVLLGFQNDYVYVNLPHELAGEFFEEILAMFEEEMDEIGFDPDLFDDVLAELHRFEKYFTLDYFEDLEDLDVDMEQDDTHIHTIMIMNSALVKTIFEDMFEDVYAIAYLIAEEGELPPYEDFIASSDYAELMLMLGMMEPFPMRMIYEPYSEDWMRMHLDLREILEPYGDGMDFIEAFYISVDAYTYAEITLPDDAKDITDLAKEMLQFAFMMEIVQFSYSVFNQPDVPEDTHTLADLDDMGYSFGMPFIDRELSTVTAMDDKTDFELDFYLSSNGEPLFHTPISLAMLEDVFDFGDPSELDREAFLAIIDLIDEDNISLYLIAKELLVFLEEMLQDPEVPDFDLYDELIHDIPRYPEAVIVRTYDEGDYGSYEVHYVVESSVSSAYDHFMNFFDGSPGWDVMVVQNDPDRFAMQAWHDDEESTIFFVEVRDRSGYQNAILIQVTKTFDPVSRIPDDDYDGLEDIAGFPRYPGSVITFGWESSENVYIEYVAPDTEPFDVWDYFDRLSLEPGWNFEDSEYEDGYGMVFFTSDTHELWIHAYHSDEFPGATTYHLNLNEIVAPDFPDEDLIDLDDIDGVPRYTGSFLVDGYGSEDDGELDWHRLYLVENIATLNVYLFYFEGLNADEYWFNIRCGFSIADDWGWLYYYSHTHSLYIRFNYDDTFANAVRIHIDYDERHLPEDISVASPYLDSLLA